MNMILTATAFAFASLPLVAQQMPTQNPNNNPVNPAVQQSIIHQESAATAPSIAPVELRPVSARLISKLDSKTAKTGDDIVVQTGTSVKIADGTEIPKGSKLVGHVLAVHPSGGQNSQVVLQFDQAELTNGKKLPIHTEIESIAPPSGSAPESSANASGAMDNSPATGASVPSAPTTASGGATASGGIRATGAADATQETASGAAGAGAKAAPAVGTIVSRNGKIAIRTTAIPGVLLANNAPGEQDPRMAQAAGILVGAQRDIQLDGGTQIVIGVASAGAKTP